MVVQQFFLAVLSKERDLQHNRGVAETNQCTNIISSIAIQFKDGTADSNKDLAHLDSFKTISPYRYTSTCYIVYPHENQLAVQWYPTVRAQNTVTRISRLQYRCDQWTNSTIDSQSHVWDTGSGQELEAEWWLATWQPLQPVFSGRATSSLCHYWLLEALEPFQVGRT